MLPVLLLTALLAGCNGSTDPDPNPEPQPLQGRDDFNVNSLAAYDQAAVGALGQWTVGAGRLTATGPAEQAVLVREETAFADGYVEAVSNRADDGGLVLRFTSEGSYYLLAFRDDSAPGPFPDRNLAVYRRVGDRFEEIAQGDIQWPRGTTRTIRFAIDGGLIRVSVDGEVVGQVVDPLPLPAGRAGLRHYGEDERWITVFDSFRWREELD